MKTYQKMLTYMKEKGLIGAVRTRDLFTALEVAGAMLRGGIKVFEVSAAIPGWAEVVKRIQMDGEAMAGVGAVTDAKTARAAIEKGARFISTPGVLPQTIRAARTEKIPVLAGALTPTEIFQAIDSSADMAMIFPANFAGGPSYVRRLSTQFTGISLAASGGIRLENIREYFDAGASMVAVGEDIARAEWVAERNFEAMEKQAAAIVSAVNCSG